MTAQAPIANTDYLELDSAEVGDRLGVWVTCPVGYDASRAEPYPVVYVLDGNLTAPTLAPLVEWFTYDLSQAYIPFVVVTIGYAGDQAATWVSLRARDLVPPGEPLSESTTAEMLEHAEAVGWSDAELEEYLESVRGGAADRFLAFLENELAPQVAERYHVTSGGAGLWGYSYGGLFALYALFRQTGTFTHIGAGSPGVLTAQSRIFELEAEARDGGIRPASLHLTLNAEELTGRVWTYRDLAIQFARLVDLLHRDRIDGLTFSAEILSGEPHATGWSQAFLRFVRRFYVE
jgi:predicted alpha/beta superfamily hydrolase